MKHVARALVALWLAALVTAVVTGAALPMIRTVFDYLLARPELLLGAGAVGAGMALLGLLVIGLGRASGGEMPAPPEREIEVAEVEPFAQRVEAEVLNPEATNPRGVRVFVVMSGGRW